MVETLGGGVTIGGATTLGGEVTLGGGVTVAGAREENTRGVFCLCVGACGTRPSGVVGGDWRIRYFVSGVLICAMLCLRMV